MGGVSPISHLEIEAWARLSEVALRPWEVQAIRAMDRELTSIYAERMSASTDDAIEPLTAKAFRTAA